MQIQILYIDIYQSMFSINWLLSVVVITGDEVKIVSTPPFADSISEGDVKHNKGMNTFYHKI